MTFVGFVIGFVAVLCIGNYYRAKKAMERQKQKRIARLSGNAGNGIVGAESPGGSTASSHFSGDNNNNAEQQRLLGGSSGGRNRAMGGPRQRNNNNDNLLLDLNTEQPRMAQVANI